MVLTLIRTFRLVTKCQIQVLELVLPHSQSLELPAELERRQHRVATGEGDPRGAGQGAVRVDPVQRVPQTILLLFLLAHRAHADAGVWLVDRGATRQQELQDLELVAVRRQDHRGDVGRVVGALVAAGFVGRGPTLSEHLPGYAGVVHHHLHHPVDSFSYRLRRPWQGLFYFQRTHFWH